MIVTEAMLPCGARVIDYRPSAITEDVENKSMIISGGILCDETVALVSRDGCRRKLDIRRATAALNLNARHERNDNLAWDSRRFPLQTEDRKVYCTVGRESYYDPFL